MALHTDGREWTRGYVQVYTGDGKGKTSAALGLALRAAGAGLRVFFAQFIKGGRTSEVQALERFDDRITVEQYGRGHFIRGEPAPEDVAAARDGLVAVRRAMASGAYDVVVLDEANDAVTCGLFGAGDLVGLIDARPDPVELVITGRGAVPAVLDRADLVTEMREVKHYYQDGVAARRGIEM
jgi:cob(I)alamin adenosyltransferase